MRAEFTVVGAGVAGLACATELVARGQDDVVLLEAGPRVGGAAETVRVREYLIERGPNTVRRSPALDRLFELAGLEPRIARAAAPAFVARGRPIDQVRVCLPPEKRSIERVSSFAIRGLFAAAKASASRAAAEPTVGLIRVRFKGEIRNAIH